MSDLLIKSPRIFDGRDERLHEDAFVSIEGERIVALGRQSELGQEQVQAHREVIELGPDTTLMPGLINMHTHMSFSGDARVYENAVEDSVALKMIRIVQNLQAALASGVTTIRDCGTLPELALPTREAVAQGVLIGPRVVVSGAITTTGGHCWFCATEADSEDEIRKAVRAHVKQGVDFIKLFATGGNTTPGSNALVAQYTLEQMCAATEEARKAGRRSAAHAHALDGCRNSIAARVTTVEHCSFQSEAGIGWDEDLVDELVRHQIHVCPTVFRGMSKLLDEPGFEPTPKQRRALDVRKQRLDLVRHLYEKGVKLVSGNDAGVAYCSFSDFPSDLVLTARGCSIPAVDVLRSATSVAAEALGRTELGTLAAGQAADLLAVSGDPLQDIEAVTRPRLVVAAGRVI
ncbi:MAG: amidohydrolase family protein [Gammaproteobacteria bacterium]|nr:amidohydrolase family protein [Gammaproteobacteria bacterium]